MSLNLMKCSMRRTHEFNIVPGEQVREEGLPLVKTFVDGKEAVQVFDGNATDGKSATGLSFAGFSYSESLTPSTANNGLVVTLDSNGSAILPHAVITGQISAYSSTVDALTNVLKRGARIANADVVVDAEDARKITIATASNKTVEVVYSYIPTVIDLMTNNHILLRVPMIAASDMSNSTGVIMEGDIYTDSVDLSADFTVPDISFGINDAGRITCFTGTAPAGVLAIPAGKMELIEYPNSSNAFIGVRIS